MSEYQGYTHYWPLKLLWLWRLLFCRREWHLWDEVESDCDHYLSCDACGKTVQIGEWKDGEG